MPRAMTNPMTPMNFLAGSHSMGSADEGWSLHEAPQGCGPRIHRSHVRFDRAFSAPPLVHLGLAGFDASNQDCARLASSVENVSAEGFDVVLTTWLHTRLWRVDVNWLAIGA